MPQNIKDILSAPIPLSVVFFLILQTMGFVWWASAQVNELNLRIAQLDSVLTNLDKSVAAVSSHEGRIIVLEQIAGRVRDDLQEIKVILRGEKQGYFVHEERTAPQAP